jgi:hypothetical protein
MDIRRCSFVVVLLLVPSLAHADRHRADAAASASIMSGSKLTGFHTTFSMPVFKKKDDVSLVGDFSRYTANDDKGTTSVLPLYLVGVRRTFTDFGPLYKYVSGATTAHATHPKKKFIAFVQGLIGFSERTETTGVGTSRVTTKEPFHIAGGATVALEAQAHSWARPRLQIDVLAYEHRGKAKMGIGVSLGLSLGESTLDWP